MRLFRRGTLPCFFMYSASVICFPDCGSVMMSPHWSPKTYMLHLLASVRNFSRLCQAVQAIWRISVFFEMSPVFAVSIFVLSDTGKSCW